MLISSVKIGCTEIEDRVIAGFGILTPYFLNSEYFEVSHNEGCTEHALESSLETILATNFASSCPDGVGPFNGNEQLPGEKADFVSHIDFD